MLVYCPVDTMPASSRPQSSAYLTNAKPIKCQGKCHLALVEQLLSLCTPWTFQKKQATAHELNHLPGKCWMLDKPRDMRWRDMKWIYTSTMDKVTLKMIWNDTTVCQTAVSQHVKDLFTWQLCSEPRNPCNGNWKSVPETNWQNTNCLQQHIMW